MTPANARIGWIRPICFEAYLRSRDAIAVGRAGDDTVLRIGGSFIAEHLANPAYRDHNPFVVEVLELVEIVDVRDFLKQLGLRIFAELANARRSDLKMVMAFTVVDRVRMNAFHEERGYLEFACFGM